MPKGGTSRYEMMKVLIGGWNCDRGEVRFSLILVSRLARRCAAISRLPPEHEFSETQRTAAGGQLLKDIAGQTGLRGSTRTAAARDRYHNAIAELIADLDQQWHGATSGVLSLAP